MTGDDESARGPLDPTSGQLSDLPTSLEAIFDPRNKEDWYLAREAIANIGNHDLTGLVNYLKHAPRLVMDRNLRLKLIELLEGGISQEERKAKHRIGKAQGIKLALVKPPTASRLLTLARDAQADRNSRLGLLYHFLKNQGDVHGCRGDALKAAGQEFNLAPKTVADFLNKKYLDSLRVCVWLQKDGHDSYVVSLPKQIDQDQSYGDAGVTRPSPDGYWWSGNALKKRGADQVHLSRLTIISREHSG